MLKVIKENPTISDRFKNAELSGKIPGWGLPLAIKPQSISGNNYLLTGDAAALIDPFSGEGIGNALYSGMLAADAAQKAIKEDKYDAGFFKENYDDILYRKIGNELKLSATLQRLCRFPWLFNFVVNKARKSPALSQTMSSMFSDLDLRAQLKKPSFYFRILFNK
jgi:flavin-dependent dehydrogenase